MGNFNKQMYGFGSKRSVIRDLFEFGKQRAAEVGADKVYDFSIGNPSVPAPSCVNESIREILATMDSISVHGYTSAQGDAGVRKAIADDLNGRYAAGVDPNLMYMTCGAAAALCISIRALNEGNDEVMLLAPYFPEYQVFASVALAKPVTVPIHEPDFQINFPEFEKTLNEKTKAVIINSPNNPCGVIYTRETIEHLCVILKERSRRYGHPIYIISDEPYRELVYDGSDIPFIMNYYDDSIVCYSFSKSLSLPGERIGYIAVNPRMEEANGVYAAICGAGRGYGYVCAPSLMQFMAGRCAGVRPDIEAYRRNRDLLYSSLSEMGYSCVHPDGAFYMFVKSLEPDSRAFSGRARDFGLLLVPADDFAAPGYVRVAYCVSNDMIRRSMPAFRALRDSYIAG